MNMTKKINIFDPIEREIRCIANIHDYFGNGDLVVEEKLEVGKIYTYISGQAASYGNMVFLKELPSKWGFQAYLFEELLPHDEKMFTQKIKDDLYSKLDSSIADIKCGRVLGLEALGKKMDCSSDVQANENGCDMCQAMQDHNLKMKITGAVEVLRFAGYDDAYILKLILQNYSVTEEFVRDIMKIMQSNTHGSTES